MKDLEAELEKFTTDAEDSELIAKLAVDPGKRETARHLTKQLRKMADEVRAVIKSRTEHDAS